jgi:hypothetical protein
MVKMKADALSGSIRSASRNFFSGIVSRKNVLDLFAPRCLQARSTQRFY